MARKQSWLTVNSGLATEIYIILQSGRQPQTQSEGTEMEHGTGLEDDDLDKNLPISRSVATDLINESGTWNQHYTTTKPGTILGSSKLNVMDFTKVAQMIEACH